MNKDTVRKQADIVNAVLRILPVPGEVRTDVVITPVCACCITGMIGEGTKIIPF